MTTATENQLSNQENFNAKQLAATSAKDAALLNPSVETVSVLARALRDVNIMSVAELLLLLRNSTRDFLIDWNDNSEHVNRMLPIFDCDDFPDKCMIERDQQGKPLPTLNNLLLNGAWQPICSTYKDVIDIQYGAIHTIKKLSLKQDT